MTALTLYGSKIASGTLAAAGTMASAVGGTESGTSTAVLSSTTGTYLEIRGKGTATAQNAVMALPAPTGNGWLFDVTTLQGQTIAAGNWTPTVSLSNTFQSLASVTIYVRFYKRSSAGVYTAIGTASVTGKTITTSRVTFAVTAASLAATSFAVGDKLYVDLFLYAAANWGGATYTVSTYESSTATGVASDMQIVTPGYAVTAVPNRRLSSGRFSLQALNTIGYAYKEKITIDHTKVSGSSNLTNFPVLISYTDLTLRTTGNGGSVTNTSGFDIIFVDTTGLIKLDHEIVSYNAATGAIAMWVRIPTLSYTVDTVLYCYYGNAAITTTQENVHGVWDSSYAGVWHLQESGNGAVGEFKDSTTNVNHGQGGAGTSAKSSTRVAGKFGYAQSFLAASTQYIQVPDAVSLNPTGTQLTLEVWISPNSSALGLQTFLAKDGYSTGYRSGTSQSAINASFFQIGAATAPSNLSSTTLTPNGTWAYLAQSWDGATMRQYINSVVDATSLARTTNLLSAATALTIGSSGASYWYNGSLQEIRISSIARSADWITTTYNSQNSPSTFYTVGPSTSQATPSTRLAAGRAKIAAGRQRLASGRTAIRVMQTRFGSGRMKIAIHNAGLAAGRMHLQVKQTLAGMGRFATALRKTSVSQGRTAIRASMTRFAQGRMRLVAAQRLFGTGRAKLSAAMTRFGSARFRLVGAHRLFAAGRASLQVATRRLSAGRLRLVVAQRLFARGRLSINAGRRILAQGRVALRAMQTRFAQARFTLQVAFSRTRLAQGRANIRVAFTRVSQGRVALWITTHQTRLAQGRVALRAAFTRLSNGRFSLQTAAQQTRKSLGRINLRVPFTRAAQGRTAIAVRRTLAGTGRAKILAAGRRLSTGRLSLALRHTFTSSGRTAIRAGHTLLGAGRFALILIGTQRRLASGRYTMRANKTRFAIARFLTSVRQTRIAAGRVRISARITRQATGRVALYVPRRVTAMGRMALTVAARKFGMARFKLALERTYQARARVAIAAIQRLFGVGRFRMMVRKTANSQGRAGFRVQMARQAKGRAVFQVRRSLFGGGRIALQQSIAQRRFASGRAKIRAGARRAAVARFLIRIVQAHASAGRFRINVSRRTTGAGRFAMVPTDFSDITVQGTSGQVTVQGTSGQITTQGTSGTITVVGSAGVVTVTQTDGSIEEEGA